MDKILVDSADHLYYLHKNKKLFLLLHLDCGFPFTSQARRKFIQDYLNRKGIVIRDFNENLPEIDWLHFRKRNKELSIRLAENTKRCKTALSEEHVNNFFDEFDATVKDVPSTNIVNYDGTNLPDDPGKEKIRRTMDTPKGSVSAMFAAVADGTLLPQYVVYKATNLYPEWIEGRPPGCQYNRSKSKWFDAVIFEDWFFKIILPYFKNKPGPKLLVII
ncbi:hypothetical protein ILUMI_11524 [Ignelater luminosus]|uniref:DDE-1 domain-containing protein n=1 Tax=Ignelater luminosus TaxID=2038154 RepID=A0A8K0D194_IGNLU|nr:hypothetical protein ILUMI_11524 [Ignelater luminosus]